MTTLPFHAADAAHRSFQFLEDLSTAYWFSETLFAALEIGLFDLIDQERPNTGDLANLAGCRPDELGRMLVALERLQLIKKIEGCWSNSQLTNLYLLPGRSSYMGDFLLYRKYMQPGWQNLSARLREEIQKEAAGDKQDDYAHRTFKYLQATDQLVRQKAKEVAALLDPCAWQTPLLDVGGGAGSLCRALLQAKAGTLTEPWDCSHEADLVELPEVLEAARQLYPNQEDWQGIIPIGSDFRSFVADKKYGLVVLSNFLHAYSPEEAEELLGKAVSLLAEGGVLLIHDYFPDRHGASIAKGPLYDLAMMLHTFNGHCHTSREIGHWLNKYGLPETLAHDLSTDSTVLVSVCDSTLSEDIFQPGHSTALRDWPTIARAEGFEQAVLLPASEVSTAPWVRHKCAHGCARFGRNLQCPPHGLDHERTRQLLDSYAWVLVLEGSPPGRDFHQKLLTLEKKAFLGGLHKAFVLGAGHCPVCESCPEDGLCRFPDKARPSMEGSGIDVYETAVRAAIALEPVTEKMQYVKYLGLLLLE